nr:RNA-directed DNA polymerase, eukaryota, reverse transcriptase zinc-binding domain protein [Tanacetum cinerariifolium]
GNEVGLETLEGGFVMILMIYKHYCKMLISRLIVGTVGGGRSGDFMVNVLTKLVEEKTLDEASEDEATIWNKWVPKKVNIFVWRMLQ